MGFFITLENMYLLLVNDNDSMYPAVILSFANTQNIVTQ